MDAASWRKAAEMAAQQTTSITDSKQLETLPLSHLLVDDSGPPQVEYCTDNPLAISTPRTLSTPQALTANTELDRQIIPGIANKLYPSFATNDDLYTDPLGQQETMANTVTDELDKYLQQATQKHKSELNYFENINTQTTSTPQQLKIF